MRRFFFAVIGIGLLVAGGVVLWVARGPQATEARTTGGVLYTQEEIQQTGEQNLSAVVDVQVGSEPAAVPAEAEFAPSVSADLSSTDSFEIEAAPETTMTIDEAPAAGVALTTDIVLDDTTGVEVAPLASAGDAVPDGQGGLGSLGSSYEQRVVELEWPQQFQVGRSGALRVKLKMLESGALQPVAEVADNAVIATPILLTDRYATHDAFVTVTLSAPDFKIDSTSPKLQPLQPGGEVEWRWTLESSEAQTAVISIGLAITWQPKPGVSEPSLTNVPIWGQTLQVEINYVFGLITVPQASIAGTALAVIGFVAQIPLLDKFLEIGLDILFGGSRRRRRREEERRRRRR